MVRCGGTGMGLRVGGCVGSWWGFLKGGRDRGDCVG